MSGGSYDYFYLKLYNFANELKDKSATLLLRKEEYEARIKFADHILRVSDIAKNIEYADSGDLSEEKAHEELEKFLSEIQQRRSES